MVSKKIVDAVHALVLAFPRAEFPAASQELYIQMLSDLAPDLVMLAVQDCIGRQKFPATIAEIRAAVAAFHAESSGRLDAYSAWEQVKAQIRRVGYVGTPELDDMTGEAVRAIGGWREVCLSENSVADRARFVAAYDTFLARERNRAVTLPGVKQLIERMTAKRLEAANDRPD